MQMVGPSMCARQHCLDRTRVCKPSLIPLCSARHVSASPFRTILSKVRRRCRGAATCCGSATPSPDLSVTPQAHGSAASQLVQSLAEDLDSLKQKPLAPACSLSIYRLTKLCPSSPGSEVALALALDSRLHNGKGVFLHIVQLLQQGEDASSQSLAADLIQAMLSDHGIALEDLPFASTKGLPTLHHSFDCNGLLEIIASSNKLKVKTSAVLVLLLITLEDSDGHHKVSESGAVTVTLLEMLSVAGSWPEFSAHQLPVQSSAGVHTVSEAETAQTVPTQVEASQPFMAACATLLHCLVQKDVRDIEALQRTVMPLSVAVMAFAVSTCNWQSAHSSQTAKMSSPFATVMQCWRRQALLLTPAGWSFIFLVSKIVSNIRADPTTSVSRMLRLANRIRRQQQAAQRMIKGSEAIVVEGFVDMVKTSVLRVEGDRCIALGPQVQRDALVRSIMPSLLALLQHPVEDRRAYAADHASILAAASDVVISALLSSSNGLSTLLTRLSGDDTTQSRSFYAGLIALCIPECNAAALKKISDSGAVPYLLQLLREADGWRQQANAVTCLQNLAGASKEIVTSIVIHGGTQQLLDLVHAGVQRLDEETQDVTCCSIETLARMLHVPAAAADINKADLAGLLLRILQGPSLESFRDTAANALYFFCSQPAGRQQLLEKLTPDSAKSLIDLSLKFFEAPEYNRSALIVATDVLGLVGEVTAGRQQLALPSVASRLSAVLMHPSTSVAPGHSETQGYVLPVLASLSYLKRNGSYAPNPWLIQPTTTPQATDSRQRQTPDQARQPSPQDSQPGSEPDPQQLPASAELSQRSTAEPAHATSLQDATSADATKQQTQSLSASVEELEAHQRWQEALVQAAAGLVSDSPFLWSRFQAMAWLGILVPQLTEEGRTAMANCGVVMASVSAIQRQQELADTRVAAMEFCLGLLAADALPVAALLEAGAHQQLTLLLLCSDDNPQIVAPAGALLSALWGAQPSLVSEFVSQQHLPNLLKLAAHMIGSTARQRLVVLRLVRQVWSFTESLESEPLLVQAVPDIMQCCRRAVETSHLTAKELQLQAHIQEEAVALLCSMARFPFYRPAIRKAEPAGALTSMLEAGCSPDDGQSQRTIAQLALTLVYKLLKGQMDESDGLDAPYNHSFLEGLLLHRSAGISVIRMCKQGSLEIRHAALSVIKLWLIHRHRPVHMDTMQQRLISLGLIPLLFGIAQTPGSSDEMRAMADACLASVHSQHNSCMGSYGTHGLLASIISITLHEQRSGTHPDKFGR